MALVIATISLLIIHHQQNPAIPPDSYAAGLRTTVTDGGYTDWYLPAICEMGPSTGTGTVCPIGTQHIVDQLSSLIGDHDAVSPETSCTYGANCLANRYWSSTEDSSTPDSVARAQFFDSVDGSFHTQNAKDRENGVRCIRVLTP